MERGFPQESVLGQLLRNIFQNELSYNVDSALSIYADDHQIYEEGKTCNELAKLLESATLATNWYDSNLVHGNMKKYQTPVSTPPL